MPGLWAACDAGSKLSLIALSASHHAARASCAMDSLPAPSGFFTGGEFFSNPYLASRGESEKKSFYISKMVVFLEELLILACFVLTITERLISFNLIIL
tara:strand:+ start:2770 stop:3066 length:297 start_codon:yes stop_codon:yes gene_type:complete